MREVFLAEFQEVQPYICTFITSRHIASIERYFSDTVRLDIEPNDEDIHTIYSHASSDPRISTVFPVTFKPFAATTYLDGNQKCSLFLGGVGV